MHGERTAKCDEDMTPSDESVDVVPLAVRRLLEVLAGTAQPSAVDECLAPTFQCHMGIFSTRATAAEWKLWVLFMRETGRIDDLRLDSVDIVADGQCWSATGCWTGRARATPDGRIYRSDTLHVRYRLENRKIVELWTVPRNYVFILGRRMNSLPGFVLVLLRFRLWCARHGERSLAAH
ncbi:MAG: hypothetical protein ACI8W7_000345 [Gammaproteobacteria bacterium]|jgi:hypothetical protein